MKILAALALVVLVGCHTVKPPSTIEVLDRTRWQVIFYSVKDQEWKVYMDKLNESDAKFVATRLCDTDDVSTIWEPMKKTILVPAN